MSREIDAKFGTCERCGGQLRPIYFKEFEEKVAYGCRYRTGRWRMAVSHLECADCMKNHCVDDSFDGPWH